MNSRPVSAALEADLREFVRRNGVAVWLDSDGAYTAFVDGLAAARAADPASVPFAVLAYRGSHLALMLDAEGVAAGVDRTPVVLHLPRFTHDRVNASPALELYSAGTRYQKALETLIKEAAAERVHPDDTNRFLDQPELTLALADTWLATMLDQRGGGWAAALQAMSLPALVDDLLTLGAVGRRVSAGVDVDVLWEHLGARTGLTHAWREHALSARTLRPEDVAFAVGSWALAVEYVFDLGRPPIDPLLAAVTGLPNLVVSACCALAAHLRERHPRDYTRWADETEAWLSAEVRAAKAKDLGKIDTLRFEEDKVLEGALEALSQSQEDWRQALAWAEPRVAGGSFWVRQDDGRMAAWQLIAAAAKLGQAITDAGVGLQARGGLSGALDRYVAVGAAVDQAHRHLEQVRAARSHTQMPARDRMRDAVNYVRASWRTWADNWSRDFNTLCRRDGFLPSSGLQQRALFDDVVRPMAGEHGTTAYFTVDALRYEMADELFRTLADVPASTVQLKARFAELPTITDVGMNALAPVVENGRLRPALIDGDLRGFSTGPYRVHSPDTRQRAMADRVGGPTCPLLTLQDVLSRDVTSLKQTIARANLVIVHSKEIDDAGENGMGPNVFESVLHQLRAAWQLLREAGVRRFVITADHGYLLLDEFALNAAQDHGTTASPNRRHAYSTVAADHHGEARVSLADLGYEGAVGHLMFPDSTAVFATGRRGMTFVHGGNSLQERVIPVLTIVHRGSAGGDTQHYALTAHAKDGVAGMHCVEARIESLDPGALLFGGVRELDIAVRIADGPDVRVEVCDVRGAARRVAGAVRAQVGETFEVFFRLVGMVEARVQVELHHPGAEANVQPAAPDTRFAVTVLAWRKPENKPDDAPADAPEPERTSDAWLHALPEGGVRAVFAHIGAHGAVTETEAHGMFSSPRALRAFAVSFEEHAAKAPFGVRIETVGGMKRYVREENRG